MNNKILVLLPLLLLTIATQCMKRSYSDIIEHSSSTSIATPKAKALKKLRSERNVLYNRLRNNPMNIYMGLSCAISPTDMLSFYQYEHGYIISLCNDRNLLEIYRAKRTEQYSMSGQTAGYYSLLGVATMAVSNTISYQKVSYPYKKIFIQSLLDHGFEPTLQDKGLALIEKWERYLDKICLVYPFLLSEMPADVTNHIALLMFETEEPLF